MMSKSEVYKQLSKKVFGHDNAKKVLINLASRGALVADSKGEITPMNCLLIGSSGTGKTYLIETLSKIMNFPYIKIDACDLTHTAARGLTKHGLKKKIEEEASHFFYLNRDTCPSIDYALNKMVIFVDEIDKLANKSGDNWNEHTQATFLTMFENKGDFSGISWVFAGAFSGMAKQRDVKKTSIGFCNTVEEDDTTDKELSSDIIKWGLMPELVGRMGIIAELDKLTEDNYLSILNTQLIPNKTQELKKLGVKTFKVNKSQRLNMVKKAFKSSLGVRSLSTQLNALAVDAEFNSNTIEANYKEKEVLGAPLKYVLWTFFDPFRGVLDVGEEVGELTREQVIGRQMTNYEAIAVYRPVDEPYDCQWIYQDTSLEAVVNVEALALKVYEIN